MSTQEHAPPSSGEPVTAPTQHRSAPSLWPPLRALALRLHFYAGVLVAPFIAVAAITGLLYAYTPQLEQWLYADQLRVEQQGHRIPLSLQVEAAQEAHPEGTLHAIRIGGPEDSTRVLFQVDGLEESVRSSVFVDPYTGEVLGTLEVYGNSASATTEPTTWTEQIPTYDAQKPYLWNALAVLTTDAGATPTYHDKECLGEGVSSIRERYAVTNTSSAPAHSTIEDVEDEPWQDDMPSIDATFRWLWNLEILEYIDGRAKTWTEPSLIGHYGADGLGVQSMVEVYANSNSESTAPADSAWQTTIPAHDSNNPYLWNALKITYEDSRGVQYTDKQCMGQGVRSITEYYKTTTTATAPSTPSPSSMTGWSTTMPSVDSTNRWLWNVELITYLDGRSAACTTPACIAHYGRDGDPGATGRSITGVIEQYCIGNAAQPTGTWQETIPTATTQNPYIWNREKITYTSGDPSYTTPQIMGKNIARIAEEYAVSISGTTAPTSGWGTFAQVQSQLRPGRFLWNRETIYYTNGYAATQMEASCIGYQGTNGTDGTDAAEVQQNLLSDANFQEGIAQNIAIGEGWWKIGGEKVTGIDGKTAIYLDNTEGETYVELLNQMLFKLGYTQKIEPGEYYTLSFWAKGTQVDTFFYGATGYQVVNTNNAVYIDGEPEAVHQADGWHAWVLDENTWVRHTYTFQTKSTVISDEYEKKLLFRVQAGQKAYVCMPKLERGLRGTAFSISPNDLTERATTFMGEFDPSKTYTGTGSIRQIVKYNNGYYMTMRTAGNFQGSSIYPSGNGLKWWWKEFDASFENIATGLLFAEEAVIENAVVRKLRTNDTLTKRVQITGNEMQVFDDSNNMKMRVSGENITGSGTAQTANVESVSQNSGYNRNYITLEDNRTLWTFNVTATNNILTVPKLKVSLQFVSSYLANARASAWFDLYIDGTKIQTIKPHWNEGDMTAGPTSSLTNWFSYTFDEIVRSLAIGQHTIELDTLVVMQSSRDWAGIQIRNKIEPNTEGAQYKLDYTDDVLEIGANGLKAVFGSALSIVQFTKENGALKIQLRSGNAGVEMTNGSLRLIIGGVKYAVSNNNGTAALTQVT